MEEEEAGAARMTGTTSLLDYDHIYTDVACLLFCFLKSIFVMCYCNQKVEVM